MPLRYGLYQKAAISQMFSPFDKRPLPGAYFGYNFHLTEMPAKIVVKPRVFGLKSYERGYAQSKIRWRVFIMSRPFLYAALASLIWGFAPAFEKVGLNGKIDPYLGVVIRTIPIAVISVLGLGFMGRITEITSVDVKSAVFVAAGGLIAGLIGQLAFYSALKGGEASIVVPVAATYPLVALLVSVIFLGEAFTWQKMIGISLVVGGVILLK